ncbi:unnamed protein product [Leuciscus chuanchicus]
MVYTGKSTFDGSTQTQGKEFGLGANVVLQLCKTIRNPSDCVVYFDNFFTSLRLVTHLNDSMGLRSLGTIRKNRLMGCSVEEDRDLLRRGRGSFDFRVDNDAKLAVVKWADNKTVTLVSSCASVNPVGQQSPIGGMGIFWQIVDIAVNNAWLLHRRDAAALGQKHQCLKDFRLDAARGLIYLEKQKRGRPSKGNEDNTPEKVIKQPKVPRPVDDMRYDRIDHFPILSVKGRCRMCQDGQTSIMCQKCKVRLCLVTGQNARNCFLSFHCP